MDFGQEDRDFAKFFLLELKWWYTVQRFKRPHNEEEEILLSRHLVTSLGAVPNKSWDIAIWGRSWSSTVLGQSWDSRVLGQSGHGAVLGQSWTRAVLVRHSLGTLVLGQ